MICNQGNYNGETSFTPFCRHMEVKGVTVKRLHPPLTSLFVTYFGAVIRQVEVLVRIFDAFHKIQVTRG